MCYTYYIQLYTRSPYFSILMSVKKSRVWTLAQLEKYHCRQRCAFLFCVLWRRCCKKGGDEPSQDEGVAYTRRIALYIRERLCKPAAKQKWGWLCRCFEYLIARRDTENNWNDFVKEHPEVNTISGALNHLSVQTQTRTVRPDDDLKMILSHYGVDILMGCTKHEVQHILI